MVLWSFLCEGKQQTIQLTCPFCSNLNLHFKVLKTFYWKLLVSCTHAQASSTRRPLFCQQLPLPIPYAAPMSSSHGSINSTLFQPSQKTQKYGLTFFMQLKIKSVIILYLKEYAQNWKIMWKISDISHHTGGASTTSSILPQFKGDLQKSC